MNCHFAVLKLFLLLNTLNKSQYLSLAFEVYYLLIDCVNCQQIIMNIQIFLSSQSFIYMQTDEDWRTQWPKYNKEEDSPHVNNFSS